MYLKTGFMVTPNLSKAMNYGWIDGTHVKLDDHTSLFFQALEKSWKINLPVSEYMRCDVHHSWRGDVQNYTNSNSIKPWIRFIMYQFKYLSMTLAKKIREILI
jgi:hypothetical protein